MAEKRMPAWRITEAFIARVPRLAPRLYSLERARHLIQKARAEAGLPKHMTLAACDHGGMTELGDAGLTEPQIMSWCAQETPAPARVYVKRTELQGGRGRPQATTVCRARLVTVRNRHSTSVGIST